MEEQRPPLEPNASNGDKQEQGDTTHRTGKYDPSQGRIFVNGIPYSFHNMGQEMAYNQNNREELELDKFLQIVSRLASIAARGNYIYRGENKQFKRVSSSLYRRYQDIVEEGQGLAAIQEEILSQAQNHSPITTNAEEDEETLAELRHNGGDVNLIDFTTDYLVALFFACEGKPSKPGKIHIITAVGEEYLTYKPTHPIHKTTAQKSILVSPESGFVTPEESVTIEAEDKPIVQKYLRILHGLSSETIYNDLYGVIQHQEAHKKAYNALHKGIALAHQGKHQEAIEQYDECLTRNSQLGAAYSRRGDAYLDMQKHTEAIEDYLEALTFNPLNGATYHNLGVAHAAKGDHQSAIEHYNRAFKGEFDKYTHYFRFESWLLLKEWERAKQAATDGDEKWDDIKALMIEHHGSVSNFEERYSIRLPDDIKDTLAQE